MISKVRPALSGSSQPQPIPKPQAVPRPRSGRKHLALGDKILVTFYHTLTLPSYGTVVTWAGGMPEAETEAGRGRMGREAHGALEAELTSEEVSLEQGVGVLVLVAHRPQG